MFCPYCGSELGVDFVFCKTCGRKLPSQKANTESQTEKDAVVTSSKRQDFTHEKTIEQNSFGAREDASAAIAYVEKVELRELVKSKDLRKYLELFYRAPRAVRVCVSIWLIWICAEFLFRIYNEGANAWLLYTLFNVCAVAGVLRGSRKWRNWYAGVQLFLVSALLLLLTTAGQSALALIIGLPQIALLIVCVMPLFVTEAARIWFDEDSTAKPICRGRRVLLGVIGIWVCGVLTYVGIETAKNVEAPKQNVPKLSQPQRISDLPSTFDEQTLERHLAQYSNITVAYRMLGKDNKWLDLTSLSDVKTAKDSGLLQRLFIFAIKGQIEKTVEVPENELQGFYQAAKQTKTSVEPVVLLTVSEKTEKVLRSKVSEYIKQHGILK